MSIEEPPHIELPDVSTFPAWGQFAFYGIAGITFAFILAVGRFGIRFNRTNVRDDPTKGEVAAIIVNGAAIDRLTAAATSLNATLITINLTGRAMARTSSMSARKVDELAKTLEDLIESVNKLRDEIIRTGRDHQ